MTEETCPRCHQPLPDQRPLPDDLSNQNQSFFPAKVTELQDGEQGSRRLTPNKRLRRDDQEETSFLYQGSSTLEQSTNEETLYIHDETRRLDRLIQVQLPYQRATLQRRLNKIRSPSYTLPPEVLSTIFEYTCKEGIDEELDEKLEEELGGDADEDIDEDTDEDTDEEKRKSWGKQTQLMLGAVSFYWRQVVSSSPRLWTSINLSGRTEEHYKMAKILRRFLENSGDLPLNLRINWWDPYTSLRGIVLVCPSVDDLIIESLPRVRELRLTQPPLGWSAIFHPLPQLSILSINHGYSGFGSHISDTLYPNSPLLSQFSLQCTHGARCPELDLNWSTITIVSLHTVPLQACIEVLVRCANLIEYSCIWSTRLPGAGAEYPLLGPDPLVLQHLTCFRWDTGLPEATTFLSRVRLPSLQTLLLYSSFRARHESHDLQLAPCFFRRLPSTLRTLHLSDSHNVISTATPGSLINHLRSHHPSTENIEHLILGNDPSAGSILSCLLPPSSCAPGILPNLTKLTIQQTERWSSSLAYGERYPTATLAAVVLHRAVEMMGKPHPFCLVVDGLRLSWPADRKDALKALADEGYVFEIIEGSKKVAWL